MTVSLWILQATVLAVFGLARVSSLGRVALASGVNWTIDGGCYNASNDSATVERVRRVAMLVLGRSDHEVGCITLPYLAGPYALYGNGNDVHAGLDLQAPLGTPVYAAEDGVVVEVTLDPPNRHSTLIVENLARTRKVLYLHMEAVAARLQAGVCVFRGQLLGRSGDVGAQRPHLHLEVWPSTSEQYWRQQAISGSACPADQCSREFIAAATVDPLTLSDAAGGPCPADVCSSSDISARSSLEPVVSGEPQSISSGPPIPFALHDALIGEGNTGFGDWVAGDNLGLREIPSDNAVVTQTIPRGTVVHTDRVDTITTRAGELVVTTQSRQRGLVPADPSVGRFGGGARSPVGLTLFFERAEKLYVVTDQFGEANCRIWRKGQFVDLSCAMVGMRSDPLGYLCASRDCLEAARRPPGNLPWACQTVDCSTDAWSLVRTRSGLSGWAKGAYGGAYSH